VTLLLTGSLGDILVYHHFGYRSLISYYVGWLTAGAMTIARSFTIAEVCRYKLRAYRGVWALAWRALILLAAFFLGHAAVDAWGQPDRLAIYGLTIERDVEISSIVLLLAMFLIRDYYGLTLEPVHNWIAAGICLFCAVDVVNNTILRDAFTGYLSPWFDTAYASSWSGMRSQVNRANDLWNLIRTAGLIISIGIWCIALRKPLPAPAQDPVLLPEEVYGDLSPAINMRLRTFNDRLLAILKP
jgi:hypothetical protein